jgi:ribonuclease P protein component
MADKSFSFSKDERLCSRIAIEKLFESRHSFNQYPLRIVFRKIEAEEDTVGARVLISVSKRKFKRAYKRNLLKRRMRESYRLNKGKLMSQLKERDLSLDVAFIYLATEILSYADIEKAMQNSLNKLEKRLT